MSKVGIVNSALIKMGEDPITSLDDPNKPARTMKEQYDKIRKALLRGYRWNFAIDRRALAPEEDAPDFGYDYRFLIPNDCLKVIGIYDDAECLYQVNYTGSDIPHKIEDQYILCDVNPLYVFLILDVETTAKFDALFAELLSWALAADTVLAITNSPAKAKIVIEGFQGVQKMARSANAKEGTPELPTRDYWTDYRHGSGRGPYRIGPVSW